MGRQFRNWMCPTRGRTRPLMTTTLSPGITGDVIRSSNVTGPRTLKRSFGHSRHRSRRRAGRPSPARTGRIRMDLDTELKAERTHLAEPRPALARMRPRADTLYAAAPEVAGAPFPPETPARSLSRRVAELADDPPTPLFFGRLDLDDADFHIGRRHVTDDAGEPMVL